MLELLIYPVTKLVVMQQPARMDVEEGLEVLHSASNPILEMVCFSNCPAVGEDCSQSNHGIVFLCCQHTSPGMGLNLPL